MIKDRYRYKKHCQGHWGFRNSRDTCYCSIKRCILGSISRLSTALMLYICSLSSPATHTQTNAASSKGCLITRSVVRDLIKVDRPTDRTSIMAESEPPVEAPLIEDMLARKLADLIFRGDGIEADCTIAGSASCHATFRALPSGFTSYKIAR